MGRFRGDQTPGLDLQPEAEAILREYLESPGQSQDIEPGITFVDAVPPKEQPLHEAPQAGQVPVGVRSTMPPSIEPKVQRTMLDGRPSTERPNKYLTETDRQAVISTTAPAPKTPIAPQLQRQVAVATASEIAKPSLQKDIISGKSAMSLSVRHAIPLKHHEIFIRNTEKVKVISGAIGVLAGLGLVLGSHTSGQDRAEANELATDAGAAAQLEDFVPTEIQEAPNDTPGPEALTPENCMEEGAAVATIFVSGRMPLDYQFETLDGSSTTPAGYLEGITESGKSELQMENIPIKIYACEDGVTDTATTGAVTEQNSDYTVNFNRMTYDAVAPTGGYRLIPTNYVQEGEEDPTWFLGHAPNGVQQVYWPNLQWDKDQNPAVFEKFSEKSIKSFNAFNRPWVESDADTKVQTQTVTDTYRAAVASVLAQAGVASEGSVFNQTCVFDGDWQNVAGAIKEGTERRVGGNPDDVGSTGAVQNIGGDAYKKISVEGLQLTEDRTGWFETTKCEVYTGDVTAVGQVALTAATAGGSN